MKNIWQWLINKTTNSWHGKEPLWKVFWNYGLLAGFVLYGLSWGGLFLAYMAFPEIFTAEPEDVWQAKRLIFTMFSLAPIIILFIIHIGWWAVAAWRCAPNVKSRKWFYAMRISIFFIVPIIINIKYMLLVLSFMLSTGLYFDKL